MFSFFLTLGVVYLAGVVGFPVSKGLSPFEFPDWKWPATLLGKFKN